MSHLVQYITVDKESNILKEAKAFARKYSDRRETGGEYHNQLTVHHIRIFNSQEEADEYISEHYDNGDYHDHAIQFRDLNDIKPTKKMESIKQKIVDNQSAKEAYIRKNKIQDRTSKTITCPKCGSRLNLKYVHTQYCPLCNEDLRSATVQTRIKKFDLDDKTLRKRYKEEIIKLQEKAPIKWRVKLEVHC